MSKQKEKAHNTRTAVPILRAMRTLSISSTPTPKPLNRSKASRESLKEMSKTEKSKKKPDLLAIDIWAKSPATLRFAFNIVFRGLLVSFKTSKYNDDDVAARMALKKTSEASFHIR